MPPDATIAEVVDDLMHDLAGRLHEIAEEIRARVEKSLERRLLELHDGEVPTSTAHTPWPIHAELSAEPVAAALALVLADRLPELTRLFLVRGDLLPGPGGVTNRRRAAALLTGRQRFSMEAAAGYARRTSAPFDPDDYRRAVQAQIDRGELRPVTQQDIDALPTD